MAKPVQPVPDGYHTVTPYLLVEDAQGLIAFLERAFGASVRSRHLDSEGKTVHAEIEIGDSIVMTGQSNDQWPAMPAMLHLYVEDVDAVYRQALAAGGRSHQEPKDMFYGDRSGCVADTYGNQWWMATHVEDVSPEEMARRRAEGSP